MTKKPPVETKVVAATGSAAAGSVIAGATLWGLGVFAWGASSDSGHAADAVLAVPAPVSALVLLAITSGAAYLGGYLARHTPRDEGHADIVTVLIATACAIVVLTVYVQLIR